MSLRGRLNWWFGALTGVFLLGACGAPDEREQESNTAAVEEAAAGDVAVSLSVEKAAFSAHEGMLVRVTLSNVSHTVDLAPVYDLTRTGNYSLRYDSLARHHASHTDVLQLRSDSVSLFVEGRTNVDPFANEPGTVSGLALSTANGTSTQASTISLRVQLHAEHHQQRAEIPDQHHAGRHALLHDAVRQIHPLELERKHLPESVVT